MSTTSATVPDTSSAIRKSPTRFRSDIQALRAIAVVSVLLYHLWPNRLGGGFIGVDVFFVISGFLITFHLVREREKTGRIAVARFWARRAARLLPASLLVLLATSIAVLVWVPESLWEQFFREIGASTLYVQNWNLLANSVDYLAATNVASPVQHFWTLSVEEQFYVFLPLILIAASYFAQRVPWRSVCFTVIAAITAGSFAYNVWLTGWSASEAYFSTLTRAWEFGAGALVAFLSVRLAARYRNATATLGMAMIVSGVLFLSGDTTPYPGIAALLPVVGTMLVIFSGPSTFMSAIGTLRPVALLGRTSYAIYLWHWAMVVVVPFATGRPLSTVDKVTIVVSSLAIAWASTTFVEDPLRSSARFFAARRPRFVAAWMAAAMAIILAFPISATAVVHTQLRINAEVTAQLVAEQPDCFGAKALLHPCEDTPLTKFPIVPSVVAAKEDDGNRSECWSGTDTDELNICTVGHKNENATHLFAVGDSHNNSLVAAYERIAEAHNWRIDIAGHAGCYWTAEPVELDSAASTEKCERWRDKVAKHIAGSPGLDAILVTRSSSARNAEPQVVDGMVEAWSMRSSYKTKVIAITDNPAFPEILTQCVEQDVDTAAKRCSMPKNAVTFDDGLARAVALDPNAALIDQTDLYCGSVTCSPVVGDVIVYRDGRHITETYSTTIALALGDRINDALGPAGVPSR